MEEAKEDEGGLKGVSHAPLMQEYVGEYMYFQRILHTQYVCCCIVRVSCMYHMSIAYNTCIVNVSQCIPNLGGREACIAMYRDMYRA